MDRLSHAWLILSDSALPLGSFAFSSSLESFVAHQPLSSPSKPKTDLILQFLPQTIHSTASTLLPFLAAAFNNPSSATYYDDILDASTTCPVARRASVSQGRALLTVYDKSLSSGIVDGEWKRSIENYRLAIRKGEASGHFPVAWGVICRVFQLRLDEACYVFMFNHAKAVCSAAVRLGLCGPYWSQGILVRQDMRTWLEDAVKDGKDRNLEEAGQTVPSIDLWQGRHEVLYSRVFNS